jgi:septal ring factor EnvC (AmiA/AmiB activator)
MIVVLLGRVQTSSRRRSRGSSYRSVLALVLYLYALCHMTSANIAFLGPCELTVNWAAGNEIRRTTMDYRGHRITAEERRTLLHVLHQHRMHAEKKRVRLARELRAIAAELERVDRQLADIEQSVQFLENDQ